MSIVGNNDPVGFDVYPARVGVSVVGILDEFCQRNVRSTDQPLAQFAQ